MAQQINLFNPVFLKQKKHFSAATMLQSLGLVVAGVLVFYGYARHETSVQTRVADDAAKQLAAQTQQVAALTREFSPGGRSRLLQDELARANARLNQREEMLAVLQTGGLGNTAGFARYLTALAHQPVGGVWLTGFSVTGDESELHLSGRVLQADLVPLYIRALSREEVMRGRRVAELRLTAREERDSSTAAPGANPSAPQAPGGIPLGPLAGLVPHAPTPVAASAPSPGASAPGPDKTPPGPSRYVEFDLIAVRAAAAGEPPAKGSQ